MSTRGFKVFVGSCVFSAITIGLSLGLVLWDERQQRERRQEGVKLRLNSIQQKQNMAEYEIQKQKYQEYKQVHS